MLGFSVREIASNIIGSLVADAVTPGGMTAYATTFAIGLWLVISWHIRQRRAEKPGMASWYFIVPCLIVAAVTIVGAAYGIGLRSAATVQGNAGAEQKPSTKNPVYINGLSVGFSNRPADPVIAMGLYADTLPRLRVAVDFAYSMVEYNVPTPQNRIFIKELPEPVKGVGVEVALLQAAHVEGVGADYWWGDPAKNKTPLPGQGSGGYVYARVVIIGPPNSDGKDEQYYCFKITWPEQGPPGPFRMSAREVDWLSAWGCGPQ